MQISATHSCGPSSAAIDAPPGERPPARTTAVRPIIDANPLMYLLQIVRDANFVAFVSPVESVAQGAAAEFTKTAYNYPRNPRSAAAAGSGTDPQVERGGSRLVSNSTPAPPESSTK